MNSDSDDDDESSVSSGGDSISSSESFSQGVSASPTADAFDIFKFWMPKIWDHYKPQMLSDVSRVAYLLSPDPLVMAHSSDKVNMDPLDRLQRKTLFARCFYHKTCFGLRIEKGRRPG